MKKLYLVWYEKEKNILNKIGVLENDLETYKFYYTNYETNDLQVFSNNGLFPGFYDLNKIYISNELFSNISKRLPDKTRPDYFEILKKFNIEDENDIWEILEKTGAKDSDDYFLFINEDKLKEIER